MTINRIVIMANNITEVGGAQRIAHTLAQGLSHRGFAVELVGIAPKPPVHRFIDEPAYRQTSLLDTPVPPPSDVEGRVRARRLAVQRLRALLEQGPAGLVITTQVWCMEHLLDANVAGWRVIGQYHSSFEAAASGPDLGRLRAAYAAVDWFTLLTDADAARFRDLGMPHAITMSNPLSWWPEQPASLAAPVLTYLGRLSAEKAPGVLLDAWHRISDRHPDWSLQFVGSGGLEDELRTSPGPRVGFLPPTSDPQSVLMASGALALPSLVEGFPLALAEAMACGVPTVAADCSAGVRELTDDGRVGLLAVRGEVDSLARQLDRLLADGQLRHALAAAARDHVTRYREETVLDRWQWLIEQTAR